MVLETDRLCRALLPARPDSIRLRSARPTPPHFEPDFTLDSPANWMVYTEGEMNETFLYWCGGKAGRGADQDDPVLRGERAVMPMTFLLACNNESLLTSRPLAI